MSSPREPGRDLRLERFGDRDGSRPNHLGESAHVASTQDATSAKDYRAAYQALIDAVFSAPGVAEWLSGLRRAMAARLAGEDAPREPAARDAIRQASPDAGRA